MAFCEVTLKPFLKGREFTHMEVNLRLDALEPAADGTLWKMQINTVSIPGCVPEALRASDRLGPLSVCFREETTYPYVYQVYTADRKPEGPVELQYKVLPRPYEPSHSCGPYFDLKAEDGGANVAGISFLPVLEDYEGEIRLRWDLSAMPEGARGVNTFGEGDFSYTGKFEKLRQSYYAMGLLKSITDGDFGFYWITEPDFDVEAIAQYVKKLYAVMAPFFRDTESVYRVFVRKDPPYPGSGGTALLRSYMFGWNENKAVSVQEKQNILAHEMVHNWPHLNDNPYGSASWYSEGTAEYYSILLPLRAGLIDLPTALSEIQTRTDAYFRNPTRGLDNMEAARQSWTDRRTQKIPYGRGIFFLANCDVKIKAATEGRVGIDDVVLRIIELDRQGVKLGNDVFLQVVRELSGLDLTEDWETMRSGRPFDPLPGSFDGHFSVRQVPAEEADTGAPCVSYRWEIKN